MKIVYKKSFQNRLREHIEFIASDNLKAAKKLKNQILRKTQSIPDNPYLFRQSIYFGDPQIRDCVFKSCTIVFKIEPSGIIVFGFLNTSKFQLMTMTDTRSHNNSYDDMHPIGRPSHSIAGGGKCKRRQ
ncbi:MAG: type II toxin-antitoxin system RelE/ParE family toxin [Saprospiraceae bacterium]|nr:type II toxin-antitoxin system RelE/ParE family toxin [Saprospiraceae bacterium]